MPEGPQVATEAPGLWYNPTDQDRIQQKPPLPCSAGAIICLCQLGNSSPVLPWLHRLGLFRGSPTGALLWEAGVHPALGPPSGTVTIGAVFPLRLQAFPLNRLDAFGKTEGVIEDMTKGVLMLLQHLFNQPMATRKFVFPPPLIFPVIPATWEFYKRFDSFFI